MLELHIRFESSWSNSFFTEPGGKPRFTSGSQLSSSTKGLISVDFDREEVRQTGSRLPFLRALQAANPGLLYRVPESFDRTVQGVLSRLVGEVRRLSDTEEDHLAFRVFEKGGYVLNIEHEHSQTTKLATYEVNDIQSGGAGLITNEVLYAASKEAQYLFGHLGRSLADIQASMAEILNAEIGNASYEWTPASPAALMDRLRDLNAEQENAVKCARKASGDSPYVTPYLAAFQALEKALSVEAQSTIAKQALLLSQGKKTSLSITDGSLEGWSLAGAVIVARIRRLSDDARNAFIDAGALTKSGGLAGLAMTGGVGNITPKDMFKFASGVKAESNRMPYSVEVPVLQANGRKQFVPSGILKKTGTVVFKLTDNPALEKELHEAIENASVGPFHFGKKGIAYVQSLELY